MERLIYRYTPSGEEGSLPLLNEILDEALESGLQVVANNGDGTYYAAERFWRTCFGLSRLTTDDIAETYSLFETKIIDGDLVIRREYRNDPRSCHRGDERYRLFDGFPCKIDCTTEDTLFESCKKALNSPGAVPFKIPR